MTIYRDGKTFETRSEVERPHPVPQGAEDALTLHFNRVIVDPRHRQNYHRGCIAGLRRAAMTAAWHAVLGR